MIPGHPEGDEQPRLGRPLAFAPDEVIERPMYPERMERGS